MKLRKSIAGKFRLTQTLCKWIGDFKKTKKRLKPSGKPFRNCRFEAWCQHFFFLHSCFYNRYFFSFITRCFKIILKKSSLQFGNESLSMKLEEQISDNENLRNKYVFCLAVKTELSYYVTIWFAKTMNWWICKYFMFIGTMQQEICVIFSKTLLSGQLKKYIYVSVFYFNSWSVAVICGWYTF